MKYFRWSYRFIAKKKAGGIIASLPYNYVDLFLPFRKSVSTA